MLAHVLAVLTLICSVGLHVQAQRRAELAEELHRYSTQRIEAPLSPADQILYNQCLHQLRLNGHIIGQQQVIACVPNESIRLKYNPSAELDVFAPYLENRPLSFFDLPTRATRQPRILGLQPVAFFILLCALCAVIAVGWLNRKAMKQQFKDVFFGIGCLLFFIGVLRAMEILGDADGLLLAFLLLWGSYLFGRSSSNKTDALGNRHEKPPKPH